MGTGSEDNINITKIKERSSMLTFQPCLSLPFPPSLHHPFCLPAPTDLPPLTCPVPVSVPDTWL